MRKLVIVFITMLLGFNAQSQELKNETDTAKFFASRIGLEMDEYIIDSLPYIYKISNVYDSIKVKFKLVTRWFTFDNLDCYQVGSETLHFNYDLDLLERLREKYMYYKLSKLDNGKYDLLFITIEN